jgi:hypothetical protein
MFHRVVHVRRAGNVSRIAIAPPCAARLVLWCAALTWGFPALPSALAAEPPPPTKEAASAAGGPAGGFSDANLEFFESKVRPLLIARCYECHSATAKKLQGELRLDSRSGALKGGETGAAVVPGDAKHSPLVNAINYGELKMPPKTKLPADEIAVLTKWVELGAPWPAEKVEQKLDAAKAAQWEQRKTHWAWQKIERTPPPAVRNASWPRTDSDRFLLSALEQKGLTPAPPADKAIWLRRVTFDLIGLPPTTAEVAQFLADPRPEAEAAVVDRLLASPHFGEQWARHWLDLVRYAETRGHEFDYPIPNAWQYRDYVIRALNADVPYDQFVREQLAGDLLPHPRLNPDHGYNESILGTGFWLLGEEVHSPVDIRQDEADRLDNRLDVMSKTFLGLTVACARCHDHKFDPITQKDYYSLSSFLLSASYRQTRFETDLHNRQVAEELAQLRQTAREKLLPLWAKKLQPGVAQTKAYLLAARAALQGGKAADLAPDALAAIAERSGHLSAERLRAWAKELEVARQAPSHPWHALAVAPDAVPVDAPSGNGGPKTTPAITPAPAVQQVVVDYAAPSTAEKPTWFTNGRGFGLAAAQPGDIFLSADPQNPIAELVETSAARRDLAFSHLQLAPNTEHDGTNLNGYEQPGEMLRTPTVTLKSGRMYYLVRGSGRCYAAVDSHIMLSGPLHGRLLFEWKGKPDQWQWVSQDLTPYQGHRAHFEFSPLGPQAPLEIARVVENETTPPAQTAWPAGAVPAATAESVAQQYQEYLEKAFAQIGTEAAAGRPLPAESAAVLGWCRRHETLFCDEDATKEARQQIAAAAAPLLAHQAELLQRIMPESHAAPTMFEGNGVDGAILIRGQAKTPGEAAPRRFLEMLGGAAPSGYGPGSGRLVLAEQLLSENDPFVSRVIVNRVWHHLFGRGIVASVDNFGILGQRPTNRPLLDHLADVFRHDQHWSLKTLIRSLVLSQAYRMSSAASDQASQLDPENLLWQHTQIRRLPAESIRDAILDLSGRLDPSVLGPPVEVYLNAFMEGRGRPGSGPLDGSGRRSIYIKVRRNFLSPMMLAFDTPIPFSTVGRRSVSNVPAQALILMNDPFVLEQAKLWAKRVLAAPGSPEEHLATMYLAAFARPPRAEETAAALAFLDEQASKYGAPAASRRGNFDAWTDLAQVLFNTKEFTFLR